MYKYVIIIMSFILLGCQGVEVKDAVEYLELERNIPQTSSIVPVDSESTYDNAAVIAKAKTYIASSYAHGTSRHYDSYGLLLPKYTDFEDDGDALAWTSVSLATMCMINKAYSKGNLTDSAFNLTTDISTLWTDMQNSVIKADGHLIRHPDDTDGTSISKDHMSLWMNMLAMAKHTECEPIASEAGAIIKKFMDYGIANDWEMGESGRTATSTTFLAGRHALYDLNNLYSQGYTSDQLELATSGETTALNTSVADFINENKYYCRQGYAGSCLRILNAGVFGNHLHFQTSIQFYIGSLNNSSPVYTLAESTQFLANLAKVGQNVNQPNWLFVAGYRYFTMTNPTFNDINAHLADDWPDDLPTENTAVTSRGCTDFQWQRVGWETCTGITKEYIGTDFLLLFAFTVLK